MNYSTQIDIGQYDDKTHFENALYAIENGLTDNDMIAKGIDPGAGFLDLMNLAGSIIEHQLQQEFYKAKRKEERIGNGWSTEEKLKNCGHKIGEYITEDGAQPLIFHCRLYDLCDSCREHKGSEIRFSIEYAANKAIRDNPRVKLRYLKNLPKDKSVARLKRIKRAGGVYRRKDNGDGSIDAFVLAEDNAKKSPEKNQEIFGIEIKPELIADEENNSFEPYERFDLSDKQEYFEESVVSNQGNDTRWSGKLNSKKDTDKVDMIRHTVVMPKSSADWEKKREIDKQLFNPETANLETESIPINDISGNSEYQGVLDKMASKHIERYHEAKMNFDIKSTFRHVREDKYKDWNRAAAFNRMIYGLEKCPDNVIEVKPKPVLLTAYSDISLVQLEMSFVQ